MNANDGTPLDCERLFSAVRGFGDGLIGWIDGQTGELRDPFETVYGEGYGPGIAAHILAGLHRRYGCERYRAAAERLVDRSLEKLERPTDNTPFTDIFLVFWSLKAVELLGDACGAGRRDEWRERFARRGRRLDPPNTNARCLLIGASAMRVMLGMERPDAARLDRLLDAVEEMQNSLGFIDDTISIVRPPVEYYPGDVRRYRLLPDKIRGRLGMEDAGRRDMKPIAYHLFSCAVLCETLRWWKRRPAPELAPAMRRIGGIVAKGLAWIDRLVAADGSFSMTERSREHFWTCGCFVYLCAIRNGGEAASMLRRHFEWWSRFIRDDGSCSVTPNRFSNALRVGFENYATMTMYVTQGFSFLLDAAEIVSEHAQLEELPRPVIRSGDMFVDEEAGYAHIRAGGSSAGVSLRRHRGGFHGGYCPATGMFNVVIGGSRLRAFPSPCYRVEGLGVVMPVRSAGMLNNGVYDGIRAFGKRSDWGPDFTTNADVLIREDRLVLAKSFNGLAVEKTIRLTEDSLEISYEFRIGRFLDALLVTHPLLLSDGKNDASVEIRGAAVRMTLGGESYRLSCAQGYAWTHHQERHMLSTSGITSQLYVTVGRNVAKGSELKCSLLIEKL